MFTLFVLCVIYDEIKMNSGSRDYFKWQAYSQVFTSALIGIHYGRNSIQSKWPL